MTSEEFLKLLQAKTTEFTKVVQSSNGDWIVKGFIDIFKNIYSISIDTKVVSKVIELLIYPELSKWATQNGMVIEPAKFQNYYPDYTLIHTASGNKFAIDVKTTIRDSDGKIKGMTLGTFQGYFRNRDKIMSINYPYQDYSGHIVLGAIYAQVEGANDEKRIYTIDELGSIKSVIKDFQFFAQPKYCIASGTPGSGNTKNIGSIKDISAILNGEGPFKTLGLEVFDDYWMYFLNKEMARALNVPRPYTSLKSYMSYKSGTLSDVIKRNQELIENLPPEISGENPEGELENDE